MGFNINIDIGGTFTDFFARDDERGNRITKTPTTHYDLSVGFMRGIRELADTYDLSFQSFLGQTDQVRYCTTLGTNSLIERTGPKLGLITTAGFEDAIFLGRGRSWADGIIAQDVVSQAEDKDTWMWFDHRRISWTTRPVASRMETINGICPGSECVAHPWHGS